MSTYYEYRDVKVAIAHRLFKLDGWKVYGYKPDESDGMTDYWSPADWDGIAEKNGYRLVVDHSRAAEERRYTVRTSAQAALDAKTAAKIAKLEEMRQDRGASAREEETAQKAIEALKQKAHESSESESAYSEIVQPGHLANPPRCNWHIEKDGVIIDKGTGLLKFANVPDITDERELKDWQDFNNLSAADWKSEWISYAERRGYYKAEKLQEIAESTYKDVQKKYALLEQFNILINRFNTTCGGMVGSTDNYCTYEEVTKTEYKTEIKAQETTTGDVKEGQHIVIKSHGFNYGVCAGYVYVIHERENTKGGKFYVINRLNGKNTKELTGSANPTNSLGYFSTDRDVNRLLKWIEKGAVAWCDLVEVKTPYEVKKVVKRKASKAAETAQEVAEETKTEEQTEATVETKSAVETQESAEETTIEDAQMVEESAEDMAKEAAPDMFATLAAAYFTGKAVKSKPRTVNQNPPKVEQPAEPETVEPEQEPEPIAPGYNENQNHRFTDEEREALSEGLNVWKPGEYSQNYCFFSATYADSVRLVYSSYAWKDSTQRLQPDKNPEYRGFLVGTDFYSNPAAIRAKYNDDINRFIVEHIPSEEAAAQNVKENAEAVQDYEQKQIEDSLSADYTREAQDLFYKREKPELVLYPGENHDTAVLIDYILEPERMIEQAASEYMKYRSAVIYRAYIRFNRISAALSAIESDAESKCHVLRRISETIDDQKTVKILLSSGHTVKCEARGVKNITSYGTISNYYVLACDRQYLRQNQYRHYEDVDYTEIKQITHGGRVLYSA